MALNNFQSGTSANAETSNGEAMNNNNKPERSRLRDSAVATGLSVGVMPKGGATKNAGLEKPSQRRLDKTARFIAKMKALRADPLNCKRCGKPRDCDHKRQCRSCLEKAAKRRLMISYKTLTANPDILTALVKRIESLEMRCAKVELWREYNSDRINYIKKREASLLGMKRKALRNYQAMPTISQQELATMNHAYDLRDI